MIQKITHKERMATKWIQILQSTRRGTKKVTTLATVNGKVDNNKHPSAEGEQHTFRNKLNEGLQRM